MPRKARLTVPGSVYHGMGLIRWVIGDQKFVKEVTDTAQARRLRISRFERDGATAEIIAEYLINPAITIKYVQMKPDF